MPRPAEIVYGKKAMFGNGRESENFSAGDREVRKHLCVVRNKRWGYKRRSLGRSNRENPCKYKKNPAALRKRDWWGMVDSNYENEILITFLCEKQ